MIAINSSRRAFIRTAGACLALPALKSIGAAAAEAPKRLAFLYIPNGVNAAKWDVTGGGAGYELSPTLLPLRQLRDEFTVISNLRHESATWGEDGPGDHARATSVYLTGIRPKKTAGPDIRLGVSVDQIAAAQIGHQTRLPSLELSADGIRSAGKCDSGYSCAYQYNLSWKSATQPLPAEQNPRAVFDRLFGCSQIRKSVLDAALEDARELRKRVNAEDGAKLDQYLDSVREIEKRIESAESTNAEIRPDPEIPDGIPESYQDHIRVLLDLMVLAFENDATRIITFMLAHDGSNRSFPAIGVPEAHHQLSHHRDQGPKLEKIAKIDRFYVEQLRYFLEKMKASNLLNDSMVVYGGCIRDGNAHNHDNLPVILAGGGGGSLNPGRHLAAPADTAMTNLYLKLIRELGVKTDRVGDSTGELAGI